MFQQFVIMSLLFWKVEGKLSFNAKKNMNFKYHNIIKLKSSH